MTKNQGWKEPKNSINKKGKPVAGRHSDVQNKSCSLTMAEPIINAQDIIKAIREGEKTINDNRLIIGVHDSMNGSGYFKETHAEYKINVDKARLDAGSYSLGDVFGNVDWNWK